jgi:hypothetical protein
MSMPVSDDGLTMTSTSTSLPVCPPLQEAADRFGQLSALGRGNRDEQPHPSSIAPGLPPGETELVCSLVDGDCLPHHRLAVHITA